MLLLRLFGLLLLRFCTVQLSALLFQLPPRLTRFEPDDAPKNALLLKKPYFPQFFSGSNAALMPAPLPRSHSVLAVLRPALLPAV